MRRYRGSSHKRGLRNVNQDEGWDFQVVLYGGGAQRKWLKHPERWREQTVG